ncbi:CHAD domain-containing protein [Mameliella alba]|nr:CHAD domain-containing protein [Antarctobacter heliothermus]MBY6144354.1 CHAD domain-containing protein [Mameliella alba]
MNTHAPATLLYGGDLRSILLDASIGNRRLVPGGDEVLGEFSLHDSFDTELAHGQRMLIASDGGLCLLDGRGREIHQETGAPGFAADMPDGPVAQVLTKAVMALRSFLPLGNGELISQSLTLLDDEDKTRARCHLRVLRAAEGQQVSLVRLERLRGYDRDFERLEAHLAAASEIGPLTPRAAVETLFPRATAYEPKPTVDMGPDTPAFAASAAIIAAHLPVARANEDGIIADHDSEFLHDYRVALRKIRSVVSLFKGVYSHEQAEALKARFSALMAVTGRLRDLDVYLIERPHYLEMVPQDLRPGVDLLFDRFARQRRTAHRALCRHLQSDDYQAEFKALEKLFAKPGKRLEPGPEADHPGLDYAQRLIRKRYRKVRRIARAIDADTPDEEVHELRIQCKKLRYLMEFFAPLFGQGQMKPLIKSLKKLQDNLGTFNDCVVQQESLATVLANLRGADAATQMEIARSVGALTTVLHQRQDAERARVMATFAAFDSEETRAGFKALFAKKEAAE